MAALGGAGKAPGFLTGAATGFSAGAAGAAGGLGGKASLMGGMSAVAKPASGGFVYGSASAGGGSLFGAASAGGAGAFQSGLGGTQFGQASKGGGGFAFGQASQFGGAGALFGGATAGGLGGVGAGAAEDPYNIDIDLTKIKRTAQPAKTFEEKSSEEKLKTMQQLSKEAEGTGAKSIMKKPGEANKGKRAAVSFGQCLVYEYDKDSASTTAAKKVDSKDISDMRDEKTKIRDMLQAKENEEVLKIQKLREMMNTSAGAQDEKDKSAPSPDKFKSSAAKAEKMEESI